MTINEKFELAVERMDLQREQHRRKLAALTTDELRQRLEELRERLDEAAA